MRERRSYVAGSFYPDDPTVLAARVDGLVDAASTAGGGRVPSALLVPHAGYACSGPVAASGYRLLAGASTPIVLVAGPAHFVDIPAVVVPEAELWSTPLGPVPVDRERCDSLVALGLAQRSDRPHASEHAIEVQLPFLQRVLVGSPWALVPLAVPARSDEVVADCLDALAGDGVLVVVSSDLSHYHDDMTARRLDRRTADAILARDATEVRGPDACGAGAVRGLLTWATRHDRTVELLGLATSAETCGGPDRVVGYGSFAVW